MGMDGAPDSVKRVGGLAGHGIGKKVIGQRGLTVRRAKGAS
ncbi:hypothetical protein [Desulfitobacterium sp.]|nr:hypothetical protein [Desulfitobacterium sp.]MEA4901574.1 hypothetical protein [Desulfitobacterium sp.]